MILKKKKEQTDSYTERLVKTWKKIQYKNVGKEVHPSLEILKQRLIDYSFPGRVLLHNIRGHVWNSSIQKPNKNKLQPSASMLSSDDCIN